MVFVRLRVANTFESSFDHSLQLSQFFIPCVRSSLPPALACAYSYYTSIPYSGISRVSVASNYRKRMYLASWMGHYFGAETIQSLIDRRSLSIVFVALDLTKTMLNFGVGEGGNRDERRSIYTNVNVGS